MNLAVLGCGYVGLTTAMAMAYLGNCVTCVDVDEDKIRRLQQDELPIYEPHLDTLFMLVRENLRFTTCYDEAIPEADVVFMTVGTPSCSDGTPDLSFMRSAAREVGSHLGRRFTVVVNKSTVPIGSGNWVETLINETYMARNGSRPKGRFAVISNPEFLRAGSATRDTLYPDRLVIGADDARAFELIHDLYKPLIEQTFLAPSFLPRPEGLTTVPLVTTTLASAELIKYAANAFLALKISYINEIANLSERIGADVTQVALAIGLDTRIGARFLQAGIGWGGSCLGKDTAALISTAQEYNLSMPIVEATRLVNHRQRERVVQKLLAELKILRGRTVGLLGLTFKPGTDDIRDAPAFDIAERLLARGVKVVAHDPVAVERAKREHADIEICYQPTAEQLAYGSDALVLVTEWPQFRDLPWDEMAPLMQTPLILDGRNFLDRDRLVKAGFRYIGMGT
jgi:UDPglucose 6-dehydrogenase